VARRQKSPADVGGHVASTLSQGGCGGGGGGGGGARRRAAIARGTAEGEALRMWAGVFQAHVTGGAKATAAEPAVQPRAPGLDTGISDGLEHAHAGQAPGAAKPGIVTVGAGSSPARRRQTCCWEHTCTEQTVAFLA